MATQTITPSVVPESERTLVVHILLPLFLLLLLLAALGTGIGVLIHYCTISWSGQFPHFYLVTGDSAEEREVIFRRLVEPLQLRFWEWLWVGIVYVIALSVWGISIGYLGYLVGAYQRQGRPIFWLVVALVACGVWGGLVLAAILAVIGYVVGLKSRRSRFVGRPWTAAFLAFGAGLYLVTLIAFHKFALETKGQEYSGLFWLFIIIPTLLVGIGYSIGVYCRDGKTVGLLWSIFLCGMVCLVYFLLAGAFLQPAVQSWEKSEQRYEVLVLFDVSGSMNTKDDIPQENQKFEDLPSRQDKIIDFLTKTVEQDAEKLTFIEHLKKKNPTFVFRFGSQLDADTKSFTKDVPAPTRDEWSSWLKIDPLKEAAAGKDEQEKQDLEKHFRQLVSSTSLGDSVLSLQKKKSNALLQGIIVFSDGRNNQGSAQAFAELKRVARDQQVPIMTVIVGEDRPRINIRITSLEGPSQARPDDQFALSVDVDGEGLPDFEMPVTLDVTSPGNRKFSLDPKPVMLKPGDPPHGQVEFVIDPAKLPGDVVKKGDSGKPELEEGTWVFRARVPKHKLEAFAAKEHLSKQEKKVEVVKKPLRVLLFAGAPMREFQFVKNMFVREVDRKRMEMSIYLQLARREVVLDVPEDRKLSHFPNRLEDETVAGKEGEKYYNLALYDLIIAFDPDWTELASPVEVAAAGGGDEKRKELTLARLKLLQRWIDKQGGGLICLGGPVNTFQLARGPNRDMLDPLLTILPVVPEDNRLEVLKKRRDSKDPHRILFVGVNAEMTFLKLDEDSKDPMAGWKEFFGTSDKSAERGFYGFYPLRSFKPGATVVAVFDDPTARLTGDNIPDDKRRMPYLVTMAYGGGKVAYLGSGEMWRLREFNENYYERFWSKLCRFVGSGNQSRSSRGLLIMSESFLANKPVHVTARIVGPDLQPVPKNLRPAPVVRVRPPGKMTLNVGKPRKQSDGSVLYEFELQPRESQSTEGWDGRFVADLRLPGTEDSYKIELAIPETVDRHEFTVEPDNPEVNDVRPDKGQMYQLASSTKLIEGRLNEKTREALHERLKESKLAGADAAADDEDEKGAERLYFTLENADFIPECMVVAPPKIGRHKGAQEDIWEKGPVLTREEALNGLTVFGLALAFVLPVLIGIALLTLFVGRPFLISQLALGLMIGVAAVFSLTWLLQGAWNELAGTVAIAAIALPLLGMISLLVRKADRPVMFTLFWIGSVVGVLVLLVAPLMALVYYGAGMDRKPIMISVLLITMVTMLSIVWLSRKLLRLA